MALFKSNDPIAAAESELAKLAKHVEDAQTAIDATEQDADASALRGDDDAVVTAKNAKAQEARDLKARRVTAYERKQAEIVTLNAARDEKIDRETRHATANEIEAQLRNASAIGKRFDAVIAELAAYTAWATRFIPEAAGLANYCKASRAEIPEALALIGKTAGYHAAAVLSGTAPATLRKPEAPFVPAVIAKPPTVQLFAMRPVKWKDVNGKLTTAQKFTDAQLTPQAAMRALASGACVNMSDPLRRQHHGTTAGNADPRLAFDLDAEPERKADPITASVPPQFTVVDRGPAVPMKIAR
jgi:hypothetical protein